MKCKYADILDQLPKCYKPPFDELMALRGRTKRLMDFVRDDLEKLALKELDEIRGVLDKVEAEIKARLLRADMLKEKKRQSTPTTKKEVGE